MASRCEYTDNTIKLWEGEPLVSGAHSLGSSSALALPSELQKEIDVIQSLLRRYSERPKFDIEYTTGLQKWLGTATEHYKKDPQEHVVATIITELQRVQQELRPLLQEPVITIPSSPTTPKTATPTATVKAQFHKQLAELLGASEAAIREVQAKYAAQGKAFFEQMLLRQEAALQDALEQNKNGSENNNACKITLPCSLFTTPLKNTSAPNSWAR